MTRKEAIRQNAQADTLARLGFSYAEAEALRKISMALRRWFERECNGEVERDEETGKVYAVNTWSGKRWGRTPDRETGALKRLDAIMAAHAPLRSYVQTDPRGAALYIIRPNDVPEGADVGAYYSRGICVY